MDVFCSDHFAFPLPPEHRFPAAKYGLLRQLLLSEALLAPHEMIRADPVSPALLHLAHDPRYVDAVLSGTLDPAIARAIGLPMSRELALRSLASVGASLASARSALQHGIAGHLGGGTHHARRDAGAGFCVFNDLAVTALSLLETGAVSSVSIVDLDVHQGDGNAAVLGGTPGIHILDLYCEANYPVRKVLAGDAVALPAGTTDQPYLDALQTHLGSALHSDIVLYIAASDPLATDRLGRMQLSRPALEERDTLVLQACRERGIPVSLALGGGYSEPIAASVEGHAGTYRAARRVFGA